MRRRSLAQERRTVWFASLMVTHSIARKSLLDWKRKQFPRPSGVQVRSTIPLLSKVRRLVRRPLFTHDINIILEIPALRTKAIVFPSGDIARPRSPTVLGGGQVNRRLSPVSLKIRNMLDGSCGASVLKPSCPKRLSMTAKNFPSGDQSKLRPLPGKPRPLWRSIHRVRERYRSQAVRIPAS